MSLSKFHAISNALWDNLNVALFLEYRDKEILRIYSIQMADFSKCKLRNHIILLFIR